MAGEKRKHPSAGESSVQASSLDRVLNDDVLSIIFSMLPFRSICICRSVSRQFRRILIRPDFLRRYWARGNSVPLLGVYQTTLALHGFLKPKFTLLDPENIISLLRHDLRLDRIPSGRVYVCDGRLGRLVFLDRRRPTNTTLSRKLAFSVYNPVWPSGPIRLPALTYEQSEDIKAYGILPKVDPSKTFRVFTIIRSGPTLLQLRIFCSDGDGWSPSRSFQIHSAARHNVSRPPVLYGGLLYILISDGDLLRVDLSISQPFAFPLPDVHVLGAEYAWDADNNDVALAHTGEHLYYAAVYNLRLFLWTATHLDNEALIWSEEPAVFDLRPLVHPAVVRFFDANPTAAFLNLSCILAFAETAHVLILKLGTEVYFFHLRTFRLECSPAQPAIAQSPGVAYELGVMFYLR